MNALPYGADAVLLEVDDPAAAWRALLAADDAAIAEVVPAARTVLVRFVPGRPRPDMEALLDSPAGAERSDERGELEITVHYDGPGLDALAEELGLSRESLVGQHTAAEYTVAFCGFAPGFGYLTGLPRELHAPRLAEPRTRVPAGAVGIAGEYTGVYPRPSPGGWRLIGHTDAALWDATAEPPAALTPGRHVRFVVA